MKSYAAITASGAVTNDELLEQLQARIEQLEPPTPTPCEMCRTLQTLGSRCERCWEVFAGVTGDVAAEYRVSWRIGFAFPTRRLGLLGLLGLSASEAEALDDDELRSRFDAATALQPPMLISGPEGSWIKGDGPFEINGTVTELPAPPTLLQRPLCKAERAAAADRQRLAAEAVAKAQKAAQLEYYENQAAAALQRVRELQEA